MQFPKPIKYRSEKYLAWIRTQPCLVCGGNSEACHVRKLKGGAGTGTKPHDFCAIPLCRNHHSYELEREYGTDWQIAKLLMKYISEHIKG
jgi:hypothetical protein